MDIQNFKPKQDVAYANTEYQPLDQHLFAVGYIAFLFYKKLVNTEQNHAQAIYFAGLLHDIGKCDPNFQSYIRDPKSQKNDNEDGQHIEKRGFSFDDYPRHNELSALIFHVLNNEANNKTIRKRLTHIGHVIYWHHAAPFRKNDKAFSSYKGLSDIFFSKVKK